MGGANCIRLADFRKSRDENGSGKRPSAQKNTSAKIVVIGQCPICGKFLDEENSTLCLCCGDRVCYACLVALDTVDGAAVCKKCAERKDLVQTCPRCGNPMFLALQSSISGEAVCELCIAEECGLVHDGDEAICCQLYEGDPDEVDEATPFDDDIE